ncbi:MAG: ferrous iron transport protein B [Erysipelotrichaceae bacterium]
MNEKTIAFVGNPNVGKSAWINALSDANFKVGNWPGVSIERKEACVKWHGITYHLIDLPGIYSLDETCSEAQITINYLTYEEIDLIVNVVDATNLERNLYLTLLLRELQIPLLLIFNFSDEVFKYGIRIEVVKLMRRLQIPILSYSALNKSHSYLVQKAIEEQCNNDIFYYPLLDNNCEKAWINIYNYIELHMPFTEIKDKLAISKISLSFLKEDQEVVKQCMKWHFDLKYLNKCKGDITCGGINNQYFIVINSLMKYVHQEESRRLKQTKLIDDILLHRYISIPLFIIMFSIMLLIVFKISSPISDFIDYFIHDYLIKYINYYLIVLKVDKRIISLIVNGIISGVGSVIVFMPLMFFLYTFLSFLEECGYMTRVAFLIDRIMRFFHLNGKSFISLIIGFGCNVPAIYSTRTLSSEKQRKLTALLVPFMSCGARLPVYVLFAAAFFKEKAGFVILILYGSGILIALSLVFIFQRFYNFQENELFVLELPPYRMPSLKIIFIKVKSEMNSFLHKAVGFVMCAMIVLWGLSNFPNDNIEQSYLGIGAKKIAFIYEPLGFGTRWECVAALPGSLIAKETVVGFMGQVLMKPKNLPQSYDLKKDTKLLAYKFGQKISESIILFKPYHKSKTTFVYAVSNLWKDHLALLRAFSFMVYILLSIPCVMTLLSIKKEYGTKLMIQSIVTMLIVPYLICLIIFQLFSFFY